jgi:hypothetical protein
MKLSGRLYTTTGEPIAFANVVYIRPDGQSTLNGTMTNEAGNWQLDVPANGSIRFSHIGHVTRTLPLGSMPFIITLDPATYSLPEAEVITTKTKLNNKWLIYTGLASLFLILIKQNKK